MEKKFHTNDIHWEIMVNFMIENKHLARGQFSGPDGKKKARELWESLTNKLNAAGYGERPREKWQKAWTDLKSKARHHAAELRLQNAATGGGPQTVRPLSELEEKILQIFGSSSFEGTKTPERGLQTQMPSISRVEVIETAEDASSNRVHSVGPTVSVKRRRTAQMQEASHIEGLYVETIELLQDINNTLKTGLLGVTQSINALTEILEKTLNK